MATDSMLLNSELTSNSQENLSLDNENKELFEGAAETSSEAGSEISLSEKIILESNEKRLRNRISSLQTSILNLKEQLKLEKEMWKEDMQKIRKLQEQQQELKHTCPIHCVKSHKDFYNKYETPSKCSSVYSLMGSEITTQSSSHQFIKHDNTVPKKCSVKQLLEFHNYKRKLAETENMCDLELNKVRQSLDDLKSLQNIAIEWGKDGKEDISVTESENNIHEIFLYDNLVLNRQ